MKYAIKVKKRGFFKGTKIYTIADVSRIYHESGFIKFIGKEAAIIHSIAESEVISLTLFNGSCSLETLEKSL